MNPMSDFQEFASLIKDLPEISRQTLLQPHFNMYDDTKMSIYYAPFDYINKDAKVFIIGITPGFTQMKIAYSEAQCGLRDDLPFDSILKNVKQASSFAGSMRTNLLAMMSELQIHSYLGLNDVAELFGNEFKLVHATSAIRYPVFIKGKNYTGHQPRIVDNAQLQKYVLDLLGAELKMLPNALIIPLGKSVAEAIRFVCEKESLQLKYCLWNFPHPSGANGHRHSQFIEHSDEFKKVIESWHNA